MMGGVLQRAKILIFLQLMEEELVNPLHLLFEVLLLDFVSAITTNLNNG